MFWFNVPWHAVLMLNSFRPNISSYVDLRRCQFRAQGQLMTATAETASTSCSTFNFDIVFDHELSKVKVRNAEILRYWVEMLNKVSDWHVKETIARVTHIAILCCNFTDMIAFPFWVIIAEIASPVVLAVWIHELDNLCRCTLRINLEIKDTSDNVSMSWCDAYSWCCCIIFTRAW